jgi:hypothetical protein
MIMIWQRGCNCRANFSITLTTNVNLWKHVAPRTFVSRQIFKTFWGRFYKTPFRIIFQLLILDNFSLKSNVHRWPGGVS